eukprot:760700-Alexandrium_andersonii.AAC.1
MYVMRESSSWSLLGGLPPPRTPRLDPPDWHLRRAGGASRGVRGGGGSPPGEAPGAASSHHTTIMLMREQEYSFSTMPRGLLDHASLRLHRLEFPADRLRRR